MFNNLIESKPKKQRTTGGLVFSVVIHAILGAGAVYGTLQAKEQLEKPKAGEGRVRRDEEEGRAAAAEGGAAAAAEGRRRGAAAAEGLPGAHARRSRSRTCSPTSTSPRRSRTRPTSAVRVSRAASPRASWAARRPVNTDQPYFEFQVEKPVQQIPGHAATCAIPTCSGRRTSRAKCSPSSSSTRRAAPRRARFKVLKSSHDLFTQAVKNALPQHAVLSRPKSAARR